MGENFIQAMARVIPWIVYYLIGIAFFSAFEHVFPVERNQARRDKWLSFALSIAYYVLMPFAIFLPTRYVSEPIIQHFGQPLLSANLDALVGTGIAGQTVRQLLLPFIPMLILDFFYYWMHRAQHTFAPLWAQHKLHHTEYALCALTAARHHWLESVTHIFFVTIPVTILFRVTAGEGALLSILLTYWGFFIHSNIKIPMGPLTRLLAGPQVHRIHHSALPEHFNRNYASFFPIWDVLFGTYCHPKVGEWPPTGMMDGERVETVWRGIWLPFEGLWRNRRKLPVSE